MKLFLLDYDGLGWNRKFLYITNIKFIGDNEINLAGENKDSIPM